MSRQSQTGGSDSNLIQSGRDSNISHVSVGLSYREARQVALDVFEANVLRLRGVAEQVARERATEITDRFLAQLAESNPPGLQVLADPDMQHTLYGAQVTYARNGASETADLLVQMLVERTRHGQRDLLQAVINESVYAVGRLVPDHFSLLSLIFQVRYVETLFVDNDQRLTTLIRDYWLPFLESRQSTQLDLLHLQYAGCGWIDNLNPHRLGDRLNEAYPFLFSRGIDDTEMATLVKEVGIPSDMFIPCLRQPDRFQLKPPTLSIQPIANMGKPTTNRFQPTETQLEHLARVTKALSVKETESIVIALVPESQSFVERWNSMLGLFRLTSVGIAIANANVQRVLGHVSPLAAWVRS